ncbi:MAG: hypothetical protein GY751_06600 [Bacteroidetes bacterium]|nr:hypothetical protein [Bacteroidota bacterium]
MERTIIEKAAELLRRRDITSTHLERTEEGKVHYWGVGNETIVVTLRGRHFSSVALEHAPLGIVVNQHQQAA